MAAKEVTRANVGPIVQVVKVMPPEPPHEMTLEQEQMVEMFVPPIMKGFSTLAHLAPHERGPHERVRRRTVEHMVDVPVPQILDDIGEAVPQERVQHRIDEHIVDVITPQIMKENFEVLTRSKFLGGCVSRSWKFLVHGSSSRCQFLRILDEIGKVDGVVPT